MKEEAQEKSVEFESNSKPYLAKRLIADGFDTVLIFGLFMLFVFLLMQSPLAGAYNRHYDRYREIETETKDMFGGDAVLAAEALKANAEYSDERFAASLNSFVLKAYAGFMAAVPVLLAVPLLNKYRATPGKLMTGIMPLHERRQRSAVWYQILSRFLIIVITGLGAYLIVGVWTFVLVPVIRLTVLLCSKKNKTILDMITGIMIIEKLSYSGIKH